ncbi:uncharacterized protein EDB91DRAFT_1166358 [Suillus paluster]|uniref:uncharacterized protein n=1 Tax=Suillus paluster TaxID=48578 RepID=UPI001B870DF4|nr:uncharacterized protein EDB91DRAFT_1166358 [Suillus paluster]KAG1726341.1 hypothetical protein EDB91DRAFT_1166358 [Suillus paluster]
MSAPGPTMKTFQKRFCTALPRSIPSSSPPSISRVRSGSSPSTRSLYTTPSSPLAFFDSPPPPQPQPSKPHAVSTSRLPVKAEGEGSAHNSHGQPPFSLALTSPQANPNSPPHTPPSHQSSSFFPYPPFVPIPFYNISLADSHTDSHPREKKQKVRYHLDVGAYGIPKKSKGPVSGRPIASGNPNSWRKIDPQHQKEDLTLAVQVGEDAYFIQENAMGVADGVGGWSRAKAPDASSSKITDPSPSALFARRLMHHCSAETLQAEASTFRRRDVSPSRSKSPHRHTGSTALNAAWPGKADIDELHEELEESLEDLEDGLDVLMILERAYESTIKAHVIPEPPCPSTKGTLSPGLPSIPEENPLTTSAESPRSTPQLSPSKMIPLMTGSSTALVAVLQHSSSTPPPATSPPRPFIFQNSTDTPPREETHDAVLKIAHLGDCMGMLVRDENVIWRSKEMWRAFNTPVQLGPASSARPRDAQILSLPVQADDILILASDGLSDNLWDHEVLDEVVRFKRSFLKSDSDGTGEGLLGRRTLAGMLSEALCSRARRVSERRGQGIEDGVFDMEDEVPFACRARESGKPFRGGKIDDISVLVAVISPATDVARSSL